jgi:predicted ATPase/DNA-binding XRE family transcriptional regulator
MDSPLSFSDWLQQRRKALGLTREQLARRVGYSVSALRKIESGERRPSSQVAELLANGLELPPEARATFLRVARGALGIERLPPPGRTGHPEPAAPGAAPPAARLNLPIYATPLVGRRRELGELNRLLADPECRLLTLVGAGGIGKTRLAVGAVNQFASAFPGGAAFVPLAPLSSAGFVAPAIADALGFSFFGPADPRTQLCRYLHDKALLIVLDNAEHLLTEAAGQSLADLLAELLQAASGIKLLVTSREPLNVQAEWVFEVSGLPVPDAAAAAPVAAGEVGAEGSAIDLFLQRARRAHVGFAPTAEDHAAIRRICRLVEGLPLAIELAAASVRVLACAEIATAMAADLGQLAPRVRDAPARHRSLTAVLEHSWRLLSEPEQQTLMRLSVFRGGFTLEAAERVAGADLPRLSGLMAKSLIQRRHAHHYGLHELVRQYGAARLAAEPALAAATHAQHAAFFLALAETAEPHLMGAGQVEWLDRLERDHDNLRAALDWSLANAGGPSAGGPSVGGPSAGGPSAGAPSAGASSAGASSAGAPSAGASSAGAPCAGAELALRLASALRWFWHIRGHFHEGRAWLAQALEHCPAGAAAARARALEAMAILASPLGENAAARALAEESAALFGELHDRRGLADALTELGVALRWEGQTVLGQARLAEGLALYRESGDRWGTARNLYYLGSFRGDHGGDLAGRAMLEESLAILAELGDQYVYAGVLISLGILACGAGDYAQARAHFEQTAVLARALRQPWQVADALTNLGCVLGLQGDYPSAQAHFREALQIYQERGSPLWTADPLCALAENELLQGHLAAARAHLQEASAMTGSSTNSWLQILVGYFSGLLAYYEGDAERAAARLEETAALARDNEFKPDCARALIALGRVRAAQGQAAAATALLQEGLELNRQMRHALGSVTAFEGLAAQALAAQALAAQALAAQALAAQALAAQALAAQAPAAQAPAGSPERAARLLGAADAARAWMGTPVPPVDRPAHEQTLATLRARLDERTLAALWAEGQAMSVAEAGRYALQDRPEGQPAP